jgi:methyltransferase, FkbM family
VEHNDSLELKFGRYGYISTYCSSDLISKSTGRYGEWAQQELDFLHNFISYSDVVVDAGAFIGTHSRAFSDMVGVDGVVHAFEPNPDTYPVLVKNAELAPIQNIRPYSFALGATRQSGFIEKDRSGNLGASKIKPSSANDTADSVPMVPLDELEIDRVDFIKADVEGMEADVLYGGKNLIQKCRPVIFLEVNDLEYGYRCLGFAREVGYVVYGVLSSAFNENNFNGNSNNIFGDAKECGFLLIHEEEQSKWSETLARLALDSIVTLDDLAALLLQKPQYLAEHQLGQLLSSQLSATNAQLFFYESESASTSEKHVYQEKRSVKSNYPVDDLSHTLSMHFPSDLKNIAGLRLDLADAPVALILHELVLENPNGERVWSWRSGAEHFENVTDTLFVQNAEGLYALCLTNDPQVELALSPEVLKRIQPGSQLKLRMTPKPLLDVLPELLPQLQANSPTEPPTNLPDLPSMTREFLEAAKLMKGAVEQRNAVIASQREQLQAQETNQQALLTQLHKAEAQLELLKEFVQSAFGANRERI